MTDLTDPEFSRLLAAIERDVGVNQNFTAIELAERCAFARHELNRLRGCAPLGPIGARSAGHALARLVDKPAGGLVLRRHVRTSERSGKQWGLANHWLERV